jgi:hypothetical protein
MAEPLPLNAETLNAETQRSYISNLSYALCILHKAGVFSEFDRDVLEEMLRCWAILTHKLLREENHEWYYLSDSDDDPQ